MVAAPGELTDRERAILGLLAEGHTVKSAIAHTGDSEAAATSTGWPSPPLEFRPAV